MSDDFPIIDAHAHVIARVSGRNRFGALSPGRWGRVQRGAECVPLLPESCAESNYTVEALVELMDRENVSHAVLLQNPTLGLANDYIAECLRRFSARFLGTIQVDPRSPDAVAELARSALPCQCILKMELSRDWGWTGLYPDLSVEEPAMMRLWEEVAAHGMSVIIDPGPADNPGYQAEAFERLTSRFASTRWVIEHLAYPTPATLRDSGTAARRQRLLELAQRPNVWLGLSAVPALLDDPAPCRAAVELLREAVALVGAEKLIWGSDLPVTLTRHTYRQLVDTVRREADFLSPAQKRAVLRDNALQVWPQLVAPVTACN